MTPLIANELVTLAYHPDGMVHGHGIQLDAALAGALLLELTADGSVQRREGRLHAVPDARPPEHPELAAALAAIAAEPGQRADRWVQRLSAGLRLRLLGELVADGVLADEVQQQWLGLVARHRFPERDPALRLDAERRLRALTDSVADATEPDPRAAALATMVLAAGLGDRVWTPSEQPPVQRWLEAFEAPRWAADAVTKASRAARARLIRL